MRTGISPMAPQWGGEHVSPRPDPEEGSARRGFPGKESRKNARTGELEVPLVPYALTH